MAQKSTNSKRGTVGADASGKDKRAQALKNALRSNLQKRKAQARAKATETERK